MFENENVGNKNGLDIIIKVMSSLGTELMKRMEEITRDNDIKMIYTHTEATNDHVVELCKKLGY